MSKLDKCPYGEIKSTVKESEGIKKDFAKTANMDYPANRLTNEQRYDLFMAMIFLIGFIVLFGFFICALLFG